MKLNNRTIRQDVRKLGALVGDTIGEQSSQSAFEAVERLRTASIDYRREKVDSRAALHEILDGLAPELQSVVARGFTMYFELINLAEERERVRAIRRSSQERTLEDGLESAVTELSEADPETVQQVLDDVLIEPTFTAHPTEARRKTVKSKLRMISNHLETLDERLLTDKERGQVDRDIEAEVTSLWQTPQIRARSPEPEDEARNVQWYLENTLFDVVGEVYDELEDAVKTEFGDEVDIPKLFEFRSWAGSDRDGNPFVTSEVTTNTLARQRRVVLERYREELKRLSGVVSQDGERTEIAKQLHASLEADREHLPGVAQEAEDRYPNEPYRQKLGLMRARLDRVEDIRPGGYEDPAELREDLATIADSLRDNGGETVAEARVDPLLRQVETFGFTLASLDLRDHQENHTEAVGEALAREGIDYAGMDEGNRVETLAEAILQEESIVDLENKDGVSDTTARVLERFSSLAGWQEEYGVEAIDTYCISMTEEPSHVLEVLFLADQAGVVRLPDHCGIDVVPLLETKSALSGARRIMGTLFENEAYRQALDARGDLQEVMIGYSDSNKENGFLAANWSLYRNQRRLAEITDDYGVQLRLFHGRGGSISRGGGPMNEAMLALPRDTVTGEIKFTEQGEAIAEKYGNRRIAERNLEQMINAQVRARKRALTNPDPDIPEAWLDAMEEMAETARVEYRDLLETEGFVQYFEEATPITVIEDLNLGSRPASRTGERNVEDLRAIPWVFSWTQSRCILPSWYALGTGIDAYLENGGDVETLTEMYEEWPFFETTLDRAALAVASTDLEIAEEYANLASTDLREAFFPRLTDEYERTRELLLSITDREGPIQRDWLKESLERRNPYVDPLNLLQANLLAQSHRSETEEQTLRLTVKGIAAGMKNTG